jgi:serine O-acetyltransferase
MGVIIGETTVIGDDCTIYQGVTLGGTGKDKGKRHPTLGNNVMVGSGAKVLGPFTVGDGAKIAAGAVVLSEVAPGATAVGVPAKAVVRKETTEAKQDLDQVHIPDPVSQEFSKLKAEIEALKQELNEIKQKENIQ